jgi:hypothetical protein
VLLAGDKVVMAPRKPAAMQAATTTTTTTPDNNVGDLIGGHQADVVEGLRKELETMRCALPTTRQMLLCRRRLEASNKELRGQKARAK